MKKIIALLVVLLGMGASMVRAETFRAELNASNSAIYAGLDAKQYVTQGYMRYGGNGIYVDTDSEDYYFFNAKLMVGSETLFPDLHCEVGFKGILGNIENDDNDESVGSVAFAGIAAYRLPKQISPIPIQFLVELSGSPRPLSFLDAENYFDLKAGIEVYIVDNAALQFSYRYYKMKFDDWDFKDDLIMLGLVIEF